MNPIESLRRSDVGLTASVKDRRLSDEEIKTVWNILPELKYRQQLIMKFLIMTGCRSTEIRTARWEWFDFHEQTWTIPASDYKTGKSVRRALPEAVVRMMLAEKETSVSKHVVTLSRYRGPEDDRPPLQPNVALFSAQIIAKTGMKPQSLHDLRRTVATRLSELGAPPHVVENCLAIIWQVSWHVITCMIIWMISVTGLLFGRITLRSWLVSLWFDPHVIFPCQQV